LLQRDGVKTIFVHRSFQEYFCALFVVNFYGPQVRALFDKLARRSEDEVVPMIFEMARDKVDREWVIPVIEEIINKPNDMRRLFVTEVVFNVTWKTVKMVSVEVNYWVVSNYYIPTRTIAKLYAVDQFNKINNLLLHEVPQIISNILTEAIKFGGITDDIIINELSELGVIVDLDQLTGDNPWMSDFLPPDAAVKITAGSGTLERWGLAQTTSEVLEALTSIKKDIEQRLGGQDSMVVRRLRIFGQRDKLKANRSKGA
jgi:hypothetical protein